MWCDVAACAVCVTCFVRVCVFVQRCAQMSPYCSIAFHPLDGMLQASPYLINMFLVPTHYLTSLIMLFYSGVWASNIHVRVQIDPHRECAAS